jgi:uncharacterized protein (DUF885 family)
LTRWRATDTLRAMSWRELTLGVILVACHLACSAAVNAPAATVDPSPSDWPPPDADSGIGDPQVADLFRRHWARYLELDPMTATTLGVHRFDDRVDDNSAEGIAQRRAVARAFLEEAQVLAARADLGAGDRRSLELLIESLEASVMTEVCAFEEWSLSATDNPLTRWNRLPEDQKVTTPESGDTLAARYARIARHVDREVDNLRRGLGRGLTSNAETTHRLIDMFEKQLAQPLTDWPLLAPARASHPDWPPALLARFRDSVTATVSGQIRPAFERYLAFLKTEALPHARRDDQVGLVFLPNGAACYRASIRAHTTLDREPRELHQLGLEQIAQLDREIAALGKSALGSADLAQTLERLRTDRSLYFTSADEVEAKAQRALDRARAAVPRAFGVLPKADCVVARIPDYEAPYTYLAYYRPPNPDGTKPGELFINVFRPETRARFEAAVLAFHESIPGHHLQIGIAQELGEVPAFRKYAGFSAFVEGWALYSERLADELGLYEDALDRLGMLSFDAWRASRLVVDTGVHALGWSRQRAIDFMLAHTALAPGNIDNEVDRYISWPGQALAYKMGQIEILELRRLAQTRLGSRFDLRAFHDVVLSGGAVSLPVLRQQVNADIARARASR